MFRALVLFSVFLGTAFAQQYVITTIAGGVPPATPFPALESSIGDPPRVALDASGNLYFAALHAVFKIDRNNTLSRIAGTGRSGNTGDGGPAINAQFSYPAAIAIDSTGNIYVADYEAGVIRKIAASGIISTVATGLNQPGGLAVDPAGNLLIADTGNNVVRRLSTTGALTVFAGTGNAGYSGDGALARDAALNSPEGLAVDASSAVFIADTFNNRIRRVSPDGIITTVAGSGRPAFSGDGESATAATLFFPTDVAADRSGTLYIADFGNSRIRAVREGMINTIAGVQLGRYLYEGARATEVRLMGPTGLAVHSDGAVYFTQGSIASGSGHGRGDSRIWRVTSAGVIQTVAGLGVPSYSGDAGPARVAQLNMPSGIAIDPDGNLFVSDTLNHRIRRINPSGRIDTVIGNGAPGYGDSEVSGGAQVSNPEGLSADSSGNVYLADTGNSRLRKLTGGGKIDAVGGNGNASYYGDGLAATAASINHPEGVAVDARGTVYIADTVDNAVRRIAPDGTISTIAGTSFAGYTGDGGAATDARLNHPKSVALDDLGNVFVADSGNNAIRKIDTSGIITTLATGLNDPRGIAVDGRGNIFVADTGNNQIGKIEPGGKYTVIAGTGRCCYAGDEGAAAAALLNAPWGIAVGARGNVFFTDSGNSAIRVLEPVASSPVVTGVVNGASNQAGAIAPREMVVIYGSGLGPLQLATESTGVAVQFNETPATVLYASSTQVGVLVPANLLPGSTASIVVRYQNQSSASVSTPVASAAPAIFTVDGSGSGQAVALNQDGSINSAARPAAPGSSLTLSATGIPADAAVTATIGGQTVSAQSASGPPGVAQVSLPIPANVAGSAVVLTISADGITSQGSVTVAVAGASQ